MATGGPYFSSESSEDYYVSHRSRGGQGMGDDRVHRLTANLHDTNRNLRQLDRMLDSYQDVGRDQRSSIDRLREDYERTRGDIREERFRGMVLGDRDYDSDSEQYASPSHTHRKKKSSVRFADDMNRELHKIHQSVRDVSSDQLKLEESFNRDSERRDKHDFETKRTLRELSDNVKRLTPPPPDPLSARVEQRLQAIQQELRTERIMSDRSDDINTLSSELKQAIQQSSVDDRLRSHYLASEAQRHRTEAEVDALRRRLDQSEGSRSALQHQIEDLRSQLKRAEGEQTRLRLHMDESRILDDMKRRRPADDGFEREIFELRGQLARSVGAISSAEELKRSLEKSERQRVQLSDHIETLMKDLENRERQNAKLITQMKETADRFEQSERQRDMATQQLQDTVQRLKETAANLEKTSHELKNTQLALHETEKKKEEFKNRAQDTIRQWKLKNKQIEKDREQTRQGSTMIMQRNEQLVKELEAAKQQCQHFALQLDGLKRELGDALAVRAAQDEQIRLKDVEVNELKSQRMDLDREVRDSRTVGERMEMELHNLRSRCAALSEDRRRLEERLSALESAHVLSQDQASKLQNELREMSSVKGNTAAQLAEASGKIHDLQQMLVELQHREKAAREEAELYKRQLMEERHSHLRASDSLKVEVNESKVREAHTMQEIQRRLKRDQAQYEATIQAMKLEMQEDRSALKISRRNEEKLKADLDRMEAQLRKYVEENAHLGRCLGQLKHEFESQSQISEDEIGRVKRLEAQLFDAQTELQKLERHQQNLIQELALEIEAVIQAASLNSLSKPQPLNGLNGITGSGGISQLLVDLKAKVRWLKKEVKEHALREQKLRNEFRQALTCSDGDRKFLLTELAKRDHELDNLTVEREELAFRDVKNQSAVEAMEDTILDLQDELHLQKVRELEKEKVFVDEKKRIIDEVETIVDSQKERERIEQRYQRLQETMKSLHDELQSTGLASYKEKSSGRPAGILRPCTPTSTPKKKNGNHVRIVESPPARERPRSTSPSRARGRERSRSPSPGRARAKSRSPSPCRAKRGRSPGARTPPPLALSDEEFNRRFLPTAQGTRIEGY